MTSTILDVQVVCLHNKIQTQGSEWLTVIGMYCGMPVGVLDVDGWGLGQVQINSFHIQEKNRGFGIGSLMVRLVIDKCKEAKKTHIILDVEKENVGAIRFYRKHGFEISGGYRNKFWMTLVLGG
jgi:ribosomal protein S18 acetylase RimI-like enzyme